VLHKGGDHSSLRQTFIPHERATVTIIWLPGLMVDSLITEYVRVLHALTFCEAETFALPEVV
jgi:alkyl hydroperoxide reductase subunit AhpC